MTAPFGIEMHSSVDQIEILKGIEQGKYIVVPPRPHPLFSIYVVQATERIGIVWIKGIGDPNENDPYGTATRHQFEQLGEQLGRRYGHGEELDWIRSDALWTEDRDWAMSFVQNERALSRTWERPRTQLPDDLHNVFLGVSGVDGSTTRVVVEYSSTRAAEAEQDLNDSLSDLL